MARRFVQQAGGKYTIAEDDPLSADLAWWAVLRTRAIDELTLAAPKTSLRLTTDLPHSVPRVADGGQCGLVARPRDVAHALVTPNGLEAALAAPGYLQRDLTPAINTVRRALTVAATTVGPPNLTVSPADSSPPTQFIAGRGVLVERTAQDHADDFRTLPQPAITIPPAPTTDVPVGQPVSEDRAIGTHVAGIPLLLPDQPLHRGAPVVLRGRVMRRLAGPDRLVPALQAEIALSGVWLTYPSTVGQAPVSPNLFAVKPGLKFAHPVSAQIQTCTLNNLGAPRRLMELASLGAEEIVVAPSSGLNPAGGDLLRLGDPLSHETEIVVTAGFTPPSNPNTPVHLRFTAPTAYIHRAQEFAQQVSVSTPTTFADVSRESLRGDSVVFYNLIPPNVFPVATVVAIEHGTPRAAYYVFTQYPAEGTPNFQHQVSLAPDGTFEWPAIGRVAQLRIVARHNPTIPIPAAKVIDFALDYDAENTLTIIFN